MEAPRRSLSCVERVALLRLRLRFGSPRCVALGVAFRVAVDLVDEMAQPPRLPLHPDLELRVDLFSADDQSDEPTLVLHTRPPRASSHASFQWYVDGVVVRTDLSPPLATTETTIRLRVSCVSPAPCSPAISASHTALQQLCDGAQWVPLASEPTSHVLVLPVVSDKIAVVSHSSLSSASAPPTSSRCLRVVTLPRDLGRVLVEEDYGHAMGAHVWDASIWLALVLSSAPLGPRSDHQVIVELGAGCGLVACVVAKLTGTRVSVVATERSDALPLLRVNLARNGVATHVATQELLWGTTTPNLPAADLVLAADVLYHWSAHEPFLATLSQLCNSSSTRVLIAHKRRSAASSARLDDVLSSGVDSRCDGCAWAHWHIQRLARVANDVDLLLVTPKR